MAKHRAPDSPGDTTTTRGEPRRAPKPGEKTRRSPSYRRVPVEVTTRTPSTERTRELPTVRRDPGRRERSTHRAAVLANEGTEYARRAAIRASSGGKPSTVGRAGAGAAAGAATGAALGSVVPGVGNAVGAGAGAVLGGAGGAISGARAKSAYKKAMRAETGTRRLLLAEFTICLAVTALSPMTDRKREEPAGAFMKRMTAVLGLFFILGLISAGGRGAARAAAGFGGLVTVVLVVGQRDLFVQVAKIFNSGNPPVPSTGPSGDPDGGG